MKVYRYVPRRDATSKPVGVKWVRVNKGCKEKQVVKCRLVAQEFADGEKRDDLFAGTPPLFVLRLLMSLFASQGSVMKWKLMSMDVKSAFLRMERPGGRCS
jgi:hypothetical protein